jgi:beta-glucosidase
MRKRRVFAHRRLGVIAVCVVLMVSLTGPLAAAERGYPFQDPSVALPVRVDDLLRRLTLDEKISLLHQFQPAIPRLGIPEFKAGTEALHGLAWTTDRNNNGAVVTANATVFPQAVGLASTWDTDLIKRVGSVVGDEARGYNSESPGVWGVQLWAPVVNLLRDPRWGRNEEGYSEDAMLTGAISTAYGNGLTGNHPRYLKTAPVLKHYLANNNEIRRDTTSSNLRPRVLREYDELAFKPAISADAATGVMGAYNLVNGRPNTVNPDFNDVVRTWTDKTLYNVTTRPTRRVSPRRSRPVWTVSPWTTRTPRQPSVTSRPRWRRDCSPRATSTPRFGMCSASGCGWVTSIRTAARTPASGWTW